MTSDDGEEEGSFAARDELLQRMNLKIDQYSTYILSVIVIVRRVSVIYLCRSGIVY